MKGEAYWQTKAVINGYFNLPDCSRFLSLKSYYATAKIQTGFYKSDVILAFHIYSLFTGEALSFYLSRLLQMDNVPAVLLSKTNVTSPVWGEVNISSLNWKENKVVALIQWIGNINSGSG